jgi:hypothetical protein
VACIIVTSVGSRNAVFRAVESLAWQHRCMKSKQDFRRTKSMVLSGRQQGRIVRIASLNHEVRFDCALGIGNSNRRGYWRSTGNDFK